MHVVLGVSLLVAFLASIAFLRYGTSVVCTRGDTNRPQCQMHEVTVLEPVQDTTFAPSFTAVEAVKIESTEDAPHWELRASYSRPYTAGVTEAFATQVVDGVTRFAGDQHMRRWEARTSPVVPITALGVTVALTGMFLILAPWSIRIRINYDMRRAFVRHGLKRYTFSFDEFRGAKVKPMEDGDGYCLFIETNEAGEKRLLSSSERVCQRIAEVLNTAEDGSWPKVT